MLQGHVSIMGLEPIIIRLGNEAAFQSRIMDMAGEHGLEPRLTASETAVLPPRRFPITGASLGIRTL